MKNPKCLTLVLSTLFVIAYLYISVSGQSAEDRNKLTSMSSMGSSVRWDVATPNSGVTMTVLAPDGRVFRKEFKEGASPEFTLTDRQGERLPDGPYAYELRLTPVLSAAAKETLTAARGKDDDPEAVRATRKRVLPGTLVESGTFSILNGAIVVAGTQEEAGARPVSKSVDWPPLPGITLGKPATRNQQHHPLMIPKPDEVINDDLVVQGSACVGLDCVNNETFGFDTIRLKENNDRIQFNDTSTAAGFPTNNWQIRANSSASGGGSFLGFVDQGSTGTSETGTIVFEVDAGAPANSLRVSSTGRVGIRTATPVLDLHMNTGDTPAMRFEQNSGGGFTAQTWDVAGNEANFFVRDVTGGSRLPFRIRPGAPTSSIDISAAGNVGIGIASPAFPLDVRATESGVQIRSNTGTNRAFLVVVNDGGSAIMGQENSVGNSLFNVNSLAFSAVFGTTGARATQFFTNQTARMTIDSSGNVGIGTTAPTDLLSVNGTASKPGGGSWAVFSDERLKTIKGNFNSGLKAVMQLQPLRYEYRPNNALGINSQGEHVGFGAHAVQKIIPEAVTRTSEGYLQVNNDPILWTMLNAIKEQQQQIEQLKSQVRQLRAASRRRR
jgi:hypothetical protein